jgi:hypothetical protein
MVALLGQQLVAVLVVGGLGQDALAVQSHPDVVRGSDGLHGCHGSDVTRGQSKGPLPLPSQTSGAFLDDSQLPRLVLRQAAQDSLV